MGVAILLVITYGAIVFFYSLKSCKNEIEESANIEYEYEVPPKYEDIDN